MYMYLYNPTLTFSKVHVKAEIKIGELGKIHQVTHRGGTLAKFSVVYIT